MSVLSDKQKLELKGALVTAFTIRADADGKILGCSVDEFADKVVRSYEKKINDRLSRTRFSFSLN